MKTTGDLKRQGWTSGMLKLLPEPDSIVRVGCNRVPAGAWTEQSIALATDNPKWLKLAKRHGVKVGYQDDGQRSVSAPHARDRARTEGHCRP